MEVPRATYGASRRRRRGRPPRGTALVAIAVAAVWLPRYDSLAEGAAGGRSVADGAAGAGVVGSTVGALVVSTAPALGGAAGAGVVGAAPSDEVSTRGPTATTALRGPSV